MGNFGIGRSHRGVGVIIGMLMLLNISLVGCRGKLAVLAFLLGLAVRHFFKPNPRLKTLKIYLGNLRLLIYITLDIHWWKLLPKRQEIICTTTLPPRFKATTICICIQSTKRIAFKLAIQPILPKKLAEILLVFLMIVFPSQPLLLAAQPPPKG